MNAITKTRLSAGLRSPLFWGGIALFLSLLRFPDFVAGANLDPSWMQAYGYFLTHHLQFGKEILFTYGPLGYFGVTPYDNDLFWIRYLWEIVVKGGFVLALLWATHPLPFRARLTLVWGFFALFFLVNDDGNLFFHMGIFLALLYLLTARIEVRSVAVACTFLALFALVKFSYMVMAVGGVLLCELYFRHQRRSWNVSPLLFYLSAIMFVWLSTGQSLKNLPAYVGNSLLMASDYGSAMAQDGSPLEIYATLLLVVGILSVSLLLLQLLPSPKKAAGYSLGLTVFMVCLIWRGGLLRQDQVHIHSFYSFALSVVLVMLVCFLSFPKKGWLRERKNAPLLAAFCLLFLCAVWGTGKKLEAIDDPLKFVYNRAAFVAGNGVNLLTPWAMHRRLEKIYARRVQEWDLPRIRAAVGNSTIDELACHQGVLLLNRMNWHPRPIFQSYAAFNSTFQEANAEFFRGADAPDFVLFRHESIDMRFPTMEDGPALLTILHRYYPVDGEKGFLLLKKADNPAISVYTPLLSRKIGFESWQTIPVGNTKSRLILCRMKVPLNSEGKIASAIFKVPAPILLVKMTSGRQVFGLFIPTMAQNDFLLTPFYKDTDQFLQLYSTNTKEDAASFGLSLPHGGSTFYHTEMSVEVRSATNYAARFLEPSELERISQAMRLP